MKILEKQKKLQEAILAVVRNQLESNEPPETAETLKRLLNEGFTEQQAMDLIGHVVAAEVFGVLAEGKPFDEIRYVSALQNLPALPWASGHEQGNDPPQQGGA